RDEAHRFAVTYHRRRARQELVTSVLSQVPGLGPKRQKLLLQHFASLEDLQAAGLEELRAVGRLPEKVARDLKELLARQAALQKSPRSTVLTIKEMRD
ncbi:MAG: helix-hairpin-helix domain-containing protein, partial [Thermodesulfobacteriota bacterium]